MSDIPSTTSSTNEPKNAPSESNNPVTISIKGLNKDDYHLILYDGRWVQHKHMTKLAKDMRKQGHHFAIIPVECDPSKVIHLVGADPIAQKPVLEYVYDPEKQSIPFPQFTQSEESPKKEPQE